MPAITKEITTYSVRYRSRENGRVVEPEIRLFKNGQYIGNITFRSGGTTGIINDRLVINYSLDNFSNILDILRNEKPLYIIVITGTNRGELATTHEPIGEGEI